MTLNSNTPNGTGFDEAQATSALVDILDSEHATPVNEDDAIVDTPDIEEEEHVEEDTPEIDEIDVDTTEDEDELSEDDNEDDSEDEDVEAAEATDAIDDATEVTLTQDGQETSVTLEELKKGYTRQADFTNKTQALKSEREKFSHESAAQRDQLLSVITHYTEQLETLAKATQPDWETLREEDPNEYAAKRVEWHEHEQQMQQARNDEAALQGIKQKEQEQLAAEHRASMGPKLRELIPEWNDKEVAVKEASEIENHAFNDLGFTPEELKNAMDPRIIRLIRNSLKFKELTDSSSVKAKKVIKKSKTLKSGSGVKKSSVEQRKQNKMKRLMETGERDLSILADLM